MCLFLHRLWQTDLTKHQKYTMLVRNLHMVRCLNEKKKKIIIILPVACADTDAPSVARILLWTWMKLPRSEFWRARRMLQTLRWSWRCDAPYRAASRRAATLTPVRRSNAGRLDLIVDLGRFEYYVERSVSLICTALSMGVSKTPRRDKMVGKGGGGAGFWLKQ